MALALLDGPDNCSELLKPSEPDEVDGSELDVFVGEEEDDLVANFQSTEITRRDVHVPLHGRHPKARPYRTHDPLERRETS